MQMSEVEDVTEIIRTHELKNRIIIDLTSPVKVKLSCKGVLKKRKCVYKLKYGK